MFRNLIYRAFIVFTFLVSGTAYAQNSFNQMNKDPFKKSQWYVGVRGGLNYTEANVINPFSVINASNDFGQSAFEKEYTSTDNIAGTFGASFMYQFDQIFVLGTHLSFSTIRFSYNQVQSAGDSEIRYEHQHSFKYVDVPVFFRWMMRPRNSRYWNRSNRKPEVPSFVPFIQFGLNFGILTDANKEVEKFRSSVGGGNEIAEFGISENVNELLTPVRGGAFLGAGFRYRIGNLYLTAEANYKVDLSNAVDDARRYSNKNLITRSYDVFDDMNFRTAEIQIGIIVPLKYLSTKEFLPVEI